MSDRRRNTLVLLIVAGLIAASGAAIATKKTLLGLELKGGVQLVYQARPSAVSKVTPEALDRSIDIMRTRVDALGVTQPEIQRSGEDEIDVSLPDETNGQRAEEEVGKTAQLYFYDWETNVIGPNGKPDPTEASVTGGVDPGAPIYGLTEYQAIMRAAKRPAIIRTNETTRGKGCTEKLALTTGCIYGSWYLVEAKHERVLCAGGKTICAPAESQAALTEGYKPPAGAKVKAVHILPGTVLVQARPFENATGKVTDASPNSFYVLNDEYALTGADIKNPAQTFENGAGGTGRPVVSFDFNSSGAKIFERVTKEIAQRGQNAYLPPVTKEEAEQHFAIVLDEQIITAPSIDFTEYPNGIEAGNGSQISGGFTITSAQNLANELQSGALPIKLALISNSQVSATLGKQALSQGLLAGLIGFAVVCAFLLAFYRVLGMVAIGGLVIYGIYFFAMIKLIPVTLTLPGIAGLILTIGVAADANIVIFERIKEEIRGGRSIIAGIATGYKRGFAAIVDANVVTFMTAFILFALATAEVKGFAFMLGIGTLVSLFTAVLATQAALGAMGRSRLVSHPSALGAAKPKRRITFDFMGASRWFFTLSGVILLIGALAIGGRGLKFGMDFTGGTRIQTAFIKPVTVNQIHTVMAKEGFANAVVQRFTSRNVGGSGFTISTKTLHPGQIRTIRSALNTRFGGGPTVPGTKNFSYTSIGPTFGATVAKSAVIAIIVSLLVISVYIALRFEWKYAVPVLIALMHDLLITAGVYALTGREVTTATVAALLTILGYSLYDTIIVFDRVRENVPRMPRAAFSQIVNRSMAEVITRSLATSFCTLLPVLSLLLFGGETLQDFAFALMVGIASGAYSSIFIASPVLTHWKEREVVYHNRRTRILADLGVIPAYATAIAGAPSDVAPATGTTRRRRNGRLTAPEQPGEQISRREFDDLVADLDVERGDGPAQGPARPKRAGAGTLAARRARGAASRAGSPPQVADEQPGDRAIDDPGQGDDRSSTPRDPAADLLPEEVVMPGQPSGPRPRSSRASRRAKGRRHGRSR